MGYEIRTMARAEIDSAVDWAAAEGWNPGLTDADAFHAADPDGFLIGLLDGVPVAAISAVRYGATFGFVGFYLVVPEQRGRGFGLAIWEAAHARLAGRLCGLDGVVDQQENYRRSGYRLAWNNARYEGLAGGDMPSDPALGPLTSAALAEIDERYFPADRSAFLTAWSRHPGLAVRRDGRVCAAGVVRPCRVGHKIGPLYAETTDDAALVFGGLSSLAGDGPLVLDVPEPNAAAVALARAAGMRVTFSTARMYTGDAPDLPLDEVYGITTFELG